MLQTRIFAIYAFLGSKHVPEIQKSSTPGDQNRQQPHLYENILFEIGDGVLSSEIFAPDEDHC